MKATVEYKGKSVTIDIPDAKLEELVAQKPRTGYERVARGELYFSVFAVGDMWPRTEGSGCADGNSYDIALYYTDERLARDNARADTLMRKLRRYAAEHGGIPTLDEHKQSLFKKYSIRSDRSECSNTGVLYAKENGGVRDFGQVYFRTKESCEAAIAEFRADLLWYFTEYDPQVREG